jgi:gliding motility-associated-like protein
MRKFYLLVSLIFTGGAVFSQALFNNNGANIYVTNGGFMIVKTNSLLNNSVTGVGQINNQGTIVVEGDITNNASIVGNGDTIKLTGDWVNNNTYTGTNSWVYFDGGPQVQNIMGSAVTPFDNLDLSVGAEKFQKINSITNGLLNLNNSELATDVFDMLVTNPTTTAITWNTGYVSSYDGGELEWITNSTNNYVFPVGSPSYHNGPSIFRPVTITPNTATTDTFGACLVKGDATGDGYNTQSLDKILCEVNPNFYHHLYNGGGAAAADITMFYNPAADGNWTDEAHWMNNEWNYIAPSTAGSALGFSTVTVPGISNFTPSPFALAIKKFPLVAGPDVSIAEGQSITFSPTIGALSGSTIDWTPDTHLSCTACADPVANPNATTRYTITVTDSVGCKLSDSLLVNVVSAGLLIPTAFSPDGNGVNDVFHVLNKNLVKVDFAVFDRWDVKVFETTDWTIGWDGTYKGMKQELGVYVWECSYQLIGETEVKTAKGNVTLLR